MVLAADHGCNVILTVPLGTTLKLVGADDGLPCVCSIQPGATSSGNVPKSAHSKRYASHAYLIPWNDHLAILVEVKTTMHLLVVLSKRWTGLSLQRSAMRLSPWGSRGDTICRKCGRDGCQPRAIAISFNDKNGNKSGQRQSSKHRQSK